MKNEMVNNDIIGNNGSVAGGGEGGLVFLTISGDNDGEYFKCCLKPQLAGSLPA